MKWRERIIVYERTSHTSNIKVMKYFLGSRLLSLVYLTLELALKTPN
jgi:hypothetical protein